MAERRRRGKEGSPQPPLVSEEEEPVVYGTPLEEATTAFGRRNPLLVRCRRRRRSAGAPSRLTAPSHRQPFHCRQPRGSQPPPLLSAHL